jgi:hypothetical protein
MGTKRNPGEFDCYKAAHPDEPMFVLLGRDPFAPLLVRLWGLLRLAFRGRSSKVSEAFRCARSMRFWRQLQRFGVRGMSPSQTACAQLMVRHLACIGCGMQGDGAYSFAEDHPSSIDVGPFCSQCYEGITELVIRWHEQRSISSGPGPLRQPPPPRPEPPANRVIREGDRGPR